VVRGLFVIYTMRLVSFWWPPRGLSTGSNGGSHGSVGALLLIVPSVVFAAYRLAVCRAFLPRIAVRRLVQSHAVRKRSFCSASARSRGRFSGTRSSVSAGCAGACRGVLSGLSRLAMEQRVAPAIAVAEASMAGARMASINALHRRRPRFARRWLTGGLSGAPISDRCDLSLLHRPSDAIIMIAHQLHGWDLPAWLEAAS